MIALRNLYPFGPSRFANGISVTVVASLVYGGGVPDALAQEKFYSLGLVAYNYTDHHISNYSVNEIGGGNVFLSSPTSGGSGVTCCVSYQNNKSKPMTMKVRWQYGGCRYIIKNEWTNEIAEMTHFFYREKDVVVTLSSLRDPSYVETHFYNHGVVQVNITSSISSPRVSRNPERADKTNFPRCKDGKKPV